MADSFTARTLSLSECTPTRSVWWRGFLSGVFVSLVAALAAVTGLLCALAQLL